MNILLENKNNKIHTLFIVFFTNFYFLLKDLQLWHNLLSPYTKFITLLVFLIFFITTINKIKIIKEFVSKYLTGKLFSIYMFYLFLVFITGPNFSKSENIFYYVVFFIYHYIAIVSICIFYIYGLEKNIKILINILIKYVLVLSILTVILFSFIVSGVVDLNNWIIDYEAYFNSGQPTKFVDYYWPYYISMFRSDQVSSVFGLEFYRVFSISSEPGIALFLGIIALIFSIKNKLKFAIILTYVLIIGSFSGYLVLFFSFLLILLRKHKKMLYLFIYFSIAIIVGLIYVYAQPNPYSIIPRIEYVHSHVFSVRNIIIEAIIQANVSFFGNGYTNSPGFLIIQLIDKNGIFGMFIFLLFYVSLFSYSLKIYLYKEGKGFISVFSLFILVLLVLIIKQAFIYYYFFIFLILSYLLYINISFSSLNNKRELSNE